MTRGQLAIITYSDEVFTSIEFNGDMYPEGWGGDAIKALEKVDTISSYKKAITKFNKEHHNYSDLPLVYQIGGSLATSLLDMSSDYFDKWFSDYVYIKNLSEDTIELIDRNKKTVKLKKGDIGIFNFGDFVKRIKPVKEQNQTQA